MVTGAAQGIGAAIAESLARRGCAVALVDIDAARLDSTASRLDRLGTRVSMHVADVADSAAVAAQPEAVLARHPSVELLVNNAGVALGGRFEQTSDEDFQWLLGVNLLGVVRMTRAFLPLLRRADEARLVNVSSLYGLIAPPGQAAYAASKFAVRGFSEALRRELEGGPVGVTVVHPGGIATEIVDHARVGAGVSPDEFERHRALYRRLLRMPPARAGEIVVRGIERRRPRIVVGIDAKVAALLERMAPVGYWKLLRWRMRE